jgi:DNA invertase Pin-like site-specific DNA recombinase
MKGATAVYYRVSDGRQADKYGPPAQRRDIARQLAVNHWLSPTLEYEDHITATGKVKRTDFIKMRSDAHAGKFKVLLVGRVDRFARNQLMGWLYIYELLAAGVYVYFCNEDIVAGLDIGWRDTVNKKLEAAETYVKVLTENILRSVVERKAAGVHVGQTPYGWRSTQGGTYYALDPECAPGIRRAFAIALEDRLKIASIAAKLNAEGFRWKDQLFTKSRVHSILTNPVAKGCWRIQRPDAPRHTRTDFDLIENKAEAVVSASEFERLQDLLVGRAIGHRNPERVVGLYTFLGLLRCGETLPDGALCNARFWATPTTKGPQYNVYRHAIGVGCRAHDMEASYCASERLLTAQLAAFFARAHLPPEAVERVSTYLQEGDRDQARPDRERLLRGYKAELEGINIGLRRGAYGDDPIEAERLYTQERDAIASKIASLPPLPRLPTEDNRLQVLDLFNLWQEADTLQRRRLLQTVFSTIYLKSDAGPTHTKTGSLRKLGRAGIVKVVPRAEHALLLAYAFSAVMEELARQPFHPDRLSDQLARIARREIREHRVKAFSAHTARKSRRGEHKIPFVGGMQPPRVEGADLFADWLKRAAA